MPEPASSSISISEQMDDLATTSLSGSLGPVKRELCPEVAQLIRVSSHTPKVMGLIP